MPHAYLARLKKRRDFLALKGVKGVSRSAFLLLGEKKRPLEQNVRLGFTVTTKMGNAVLRNRIRRRLRAVVALCPFSVFEPGWDYNVVARKKAAKKDFVLLCQDIKRSLKTIHQEHKRKHDR